MVAGTLEGFLLDRGLVTPAELGKARQVGGETGERLVTTIRRLGILAGQDLARAVAAYYELPTVREDDWPKGAVLGDALSPRYLREHKVLPLAADERYLVLAVADPGHTEAIGAVRLATGRTHRGAAWRQPRTSMPPSTASSLPTPRPLRRLPPALPRATTTSSI